MKVTVQVDGVHHPATVPYPGATHVVVAGVRRCPGCGPTGDAGLLVSGGDKHAESHDTWAAPAHCVACGCRVGVVRAQLSTIFGVEEDERVLNGRCRVY